MAYTSQIAVIAALLVILLTLDSSHVQAARHKSKPKPCPKILLKRKPCPPHRSPAKSPKRSPPGSVVLPLSPPPRPPHPISPSPKPSPKPSPSPLPKPNAPPNPPPSPPKPPSRPPFPPPPPQGTAPPGAAVFRQFGSASQIPTGYRLASVDDAIYQKSEIMAAIQNTSSGVALSDGWVYSRPNEQNYIFSEPNPLLENGPFMYTTKPLPVGQAWRVIYGNSSIPYGYRLATCYEAANYRFQGWDNSTTACGYQDGYASPPPFQGAFAETTCQAPPPGLDTSQCGLYALSNTNGCEYVTGYTLYQGLEINGSAFDPQPRLVNNASGIASVCNQRVRCVGFNTSAYLKNDLPAYSELVPTYGNNTCSGTYIPTARAGCGISGYNFYFSYDSPGAFGTSTYIVPGNSRAVAANCSADPNCVGFSTKGRTKILIQDRSQWTQWTTNPCQGLFIKRDSGYNP